MFQMTFLGTSAGVPTKHRNVSALAIECVHLSGKNGDSISKSNKHDELPKNDKQQNRSKSPWVLIDCGEGTQHQLLHTKLSVQQLAVICITHVHGDHCYGLPGLLASMAMAGRRDKLTLIAPKAIAQLLDVLTITTELHFNYPIEFVAIEDVLENKRELSFVFTPSHQLDIAVTALSHRVASHAFTLTQTLSIRKLDTAKLQAMGIAAGRIWGRLQQGENVMLDESTSNALNAQNQSSLTAPTVLQADAFVDTLTEITKIVVAGDNDTPELLKDAVIDASLVVHEATYTQAVADAINARPESFDPMHTTAKQIAQFSEMANVPNLIVTHFSARYQPFDDPDANTANMADIRQEMQQYYQGNLWLARDFAQFIVQTNGQVQALK